MSQFAALELDTEKPGRLMLLDRNRAPLVDASGRQGYIDLYSMDSEYAAKQEDAVLRKRLAVKGRMKISPEEIKAERLDLLVALTVGWDLAVTDVPFSKEAARELYSNRKLLYIREQVEEFIGERENFT
jgi:hypothetical protein